jgi:hypothetical protein
LAANRPITRAAPPPQGRLQRLRRFDIIAPRRRFPARYRREGLRFERRTGASFNSPQMRTQKSRRSGRWEIFARNTGPRFTRFCGTAGGHRPMRRIWCRPFSSI